MENRETIERKQVKDELCEIIYKILSAKNKEKEREAIASFEETHKLLGYQTNSFCVETKSYKHQIIFKKLAIACPEADFRLNGVKLPKIEKECCCIQ